MVTKRFIFISVSFSDLCSSGGVVTPIVCTEIATKPTVFAIFLTYFSVSEGVTVGPCTPTGFCSITRLCGGGVSFATSRKMGISDLAKIRIPVCASSLVSVINSTGFGRFSEDLVENVSGMGCFRDRIGDYYFTFVCRTCLS